MTGVGRSHGGFGEETNGIIQRISEFQVQGDGVGSFFHFGEKHPGAGVGKTGKDPHGIAQGRAGHGGHAHGAMHGRQGAQAGLQGQIRRFTHVLRVCNQLTGTGPVNEPIAGLKGVGVDPGVGHQGIQAILIKPQGLGDHAAVGQSQVGFHRTVSSLAGGSAM